MTIGLKFRINQYNWLGQKLLAQHRYNEIIRLNQYLSGSHPFANVLRPTSDLISYTNGLALMKTSIHLDQLILSLQKLNFQKSNQQFLLLCQCLLYLGNYDSVVALCRQTINKEININVATKFDDNDDKEAINGWRLESISEESLEFRKIFAIIHQNPMINDPRLWFIFGTSLELQLQLKDAELAYTLASKLAANTDYKVQAIDDIHPNSECRPKSTLIRNYTEPHAYLAEFLAKKGDYKTAVRILNQASALERSNYTLSPLLCLTMTAQPNSNSNHFAKAIEVIHSLEMQSVSNRNPSIGYNRFAQICRHKLNLIQLSNGPALLDQLASSSDEACDNLTYILTKSHIIINSLIQNFDNAIVMYENKFTKAFTTDETQLAIQARYRSSILHQVDKLIESIRSCEPECWSSSSLWNNLGVCYLMKKRYIACLSCFMRAQQLDPSDWRVNYNLALVYLHVGLAHRALICLMTAKSSCSSQGADQSQVSGMKGNNLRSMINTLMAITYDLLNEFDEARGLYIETTQSKRDNSTVDGNHASVLSIVNYLALLHRSSELQPADEALKLKGHLLDQLEQLWLQRDPNDSQFNILILEIARHIGEETSKSQNPSMKKNYAWTKIKG